MSKHSVSLAPAARRWGEMAYRWIRTYARTHRKFIGEECTRAAREAGIAPPHDPRAWGSPFRRAAREGVIRRAGYTQSPRRHLAPTTLWRSALYGGMGDAPEVLPESTDDQAGRPDAAAVP